MDNTKLMPGRIMVLLVVSGTILGALGLYQPFADWAGAGATVPLLGFGNTLWKGVWKSMGEDGLLGIFEGGFTASAVGIDPLVINVMFALPVDFFTVLIAMFYISPIGLSTYSANQAAGQN